MSKSALLSMRTESEVVMADQVQKLKARSLLCGAIHGPDRRLDAEIGRALGWRVSRDDWWNHKGQDENGTPTYDPPGDEWCIRRDARPDVPCNEALPCFTFMVRRDAESLIDAA